MRIAFCSLLVACAFACGSSNPTPDGSATTIVEITVEPPNQEVLIDGATPAMLAYSALGRFADGHTEDVTDRVQFMLSNGGVGRFEANQFTSGLTQGGRTRVIAELDSVRGETGLVVRIRQAHSDPAATDLPVDPAAPFGGPADASRAPDVVYPNDGVLVPPNLLRLEVHFRPGANNTLFEIAFQNDLTDIRVYTRCIVPMNGGCIYTLDSKVWKAIAETNRGGDPLTVRARATDDAGSGVGTSTDTTLAFSFENVRGGIYYWKASGGATGDSAIMRYDFAEAAQTTAQRFVGPDQAGGRCVGCHAISRDGQKMVASAGGWDVEDSLLVDVKTATRVATPAKSAFASWNPDGTLYVGVFGYTGTWSHNLMMFDGSNGSMIATIDVGATEAQSTSHPDWSPDGNTIAYVRVGQALAEGANNQRFYNGGIHTLSYQGGAVGAPVEIVPAVAGKNRYYPAFSPDSSLLAFNESTCPSGSAHRDCNADTDPTATLFVTKPQSGATPIALARANAAGKTDTTSALTNSWPKWAPFEFQRTETPNTRLVWLTFSSTRGYGLRRPPAGAMGESASGTLLWMVAIDPDRAHAGDDPSYAAFCLPFQDIDSSNHIAQWTEEVVVLQ